MGAMSNGELEEAITIFNEAITINPQNAVLFAKRAQVLVGPFSSV